MYLSSYTTSLAVDSYAARLPASRSYTRYDRPYSNVAYVPASSYGVQDVFYEARASPAVTLTTPPPAQQAPSGGDYVAEIGRASWKVMHSVADRFPQFPSPLEQQAALQFMNSFAILYPCEKCRISFQQLLRQYPPDVSSQAAFSAWMSFFHNQINAHLGKPVTPSNGNASPSPSTSLTRTTSAPGGSLGAAERRYTSPTVVERYAAAGGYSSPRPGGGYGSSSYGTTSIPSGYGSTSIPGGYGSTSIPGYGSTSIPGN
eukprot:EG_transcript_13401